MNTPSHNPGLLKIELAMHGARVDPSVRELSDLLRVPWVPDSIAPSVELVLPEEIWTRVVLDEQATRGSPYRLAGDSQRIWIDNDGTQCEVRIVTPPEYYGKTTSSGVPMWRIGTISGGHVAINPAGACRTTRLGTPCRFCDTGAHAGLHTEPLAIADVVETVGAAFAEGVVELVYLHVGAVDDAYAGVDFLEPYVHAIKKHFDTLVAVQLLPPADNRWIDRTYAMGVDALSYGIEIHDPDVLARCTGGRAQPVARARYYEALRYAASIFPSGTVWSDLVVGLEPPAATIDGINALVGMGVLPVLSLVRPREDDPLCDRAVPSTSDLVPVFAHLFDTVRQTKINMNWIRDLSTAVTPLEARFFSRDGANALGMSGQFYRSRLGGLAARNLSRLRRRLRVRKVSDSFDASHL